MRKILIGITLFFLAWSVHFGQWTPVVAVSEIDAKSSRWGQCTIAPDGVVHIVWEEDDIGFRDIFYRNYDGDSFSSIRNLTANAPNGRVQRERPYIDCNAKGKIAVIYQELGSEVWMAVYDPAADDPRWELERVSTPGDGGGEPCITVDYDGNIYAVWYSESAGISYTRCKINGTWEDTKRMSSGARSTKVGIASGREQGDWVYVIWREKQGNGQYKIKYSRRKSTSDWSSDEFVNFGNYEESQTHPHITVGPDKMARVTYGNLAEGSSYQIRVVVIDEDRQIYRESVTPPNLQHYPRVAVDPDNNVYIAVQVGPGDRGTGVIVTDNSADNTPGEGVWSTPFLFPGGGQKVPGISADPYDGNIAIVYDAAHAGSTEKEIWLSTLKPVEVKYFDPPVAASCEIAVSAAMREAVTSYTLTWEKNPNNTEKFLSGYNIYVKEGHQDWQIFKFVDKSEVESDEKTYQKTYSSGTDFTTGGANVKRQFGIKTVSTWGQESDLKIID